MSHAYELATKAIARLEAMSSDEFKKELISCGHSFIKDTHYNYSKGFVCSSHSVKINHFYTVFQASDDDDGGCRLAA